MTDVELEARLMSFGLDPAGPKVTALGGGHGLAAALEAAQCYAGAITGVVSVGDDGGSSGRLIRDLGIPPPGDIRRCLLALTPEPSVLSELFAYRFESSDVGGHSLGNLMLAALADLQGDFVDAVKTAGELLGALGRIIPVAAEAVRLSAVVGDQIVTGQVAIARARGGVRRLWIEPDEVEATPDALAAVAAADQIVLGPGSLFTSLVAVLLVPGMAAAVRNARGSKVVVLNLIDQDGETLGLDGRAHLEALARTVGLVGPGAIVVHRGPLTVPEGHRRVELDAADAAEFGWRLVEADVADSAADWPSHHPLKLGRVLERIVGG